MARLATRDKDSGGVEFVECYSLSDCISKMRQKKERDMC